MISSPETLGPTDSTAAKTTCGSTVFSAASISFSCSGVTDPVSSVVPMRIMATCLVVPKAGSKTSVIETSPRSRSLIAWR